MPTITHTDYLLQKATGASTLVIVPGVWVRLLNNSTATNYYSTAVTDAQGAFTHSAIPGDYSLYYGPTQTVGGTPTLVNAHYPVPVTAGDDAVFGSITALLSGPYSASALAGGGDFAGNERLAQGPLIDITASAYNAKGDCRWVTDAAITIGTPNMTSATAAFVQADVGKIAIISLAGAGGQELIAPILSVQSGTACTLSINATATVSAKAACIGTDNASRIQLAINYQQLNGGRVYVPTGKFLVTNYGGPGAGLIPAPGAGFAFTDSTRDLIMEGDGQLNSVLIHGGAFGFDGLLGYISGPKLSRWVLSDLTLDGNYVGVAGGVISQDLTGVPALAVLYWPYTTATASVYNGLYHDFFRVRFYRPSAFGTQGTKGGKFIGCAFEQCGQPISGTHIDNIGSGEGDAIVLGCTWKDSAGNYVDMIDPTGGAGHMLRCIFIGNESFNHNSGGLYGAGLGSIIIGNRLNNSAGVGGGIGYDGGTHVSMRGKNLVAGNILDGITVNTSGLSASSYGDLVFGNIASNESPSIPAGFNAFLQGQLQFTFTRQSILFGSGTITPDLSQGNVITVGTLTGTLTINSPTNVTPGQLVFLEFTQDGTGARAVNWGAFWRGGIQPVRNASSTCIVACFVGSDSSLYWLTPTPVDGSRRIDSSQAQFEGIPLINNVSAVQAPSLTANGNDVFLNGNAGSVYLRPTSGSNNNMLASAAGAGTWTTYDSGGAARNTLDDGSGNAATKLKKTVASGVATTGGGSTTGFVSFGSAPALGIYFGSGAPTISAPKGSLYLRTDGTTTNDRAYINTNAGTTWTALTTAA